MVKKTKRPKPVVGQTLYVTIGSILGGDFDDIYEYIVTKVNTASFYAHNKNNDYERRFSLNNFTHKGTFEYHYAYFTKEEILKKQAIAKEKRELKAHLLKNVHNLNLKQLREIKYVIDSK